MNFDQVTLIVLDSVGIGGAPDADVYGDSGSNTLGNLAAAVGGVHLPHLADLGLGNLARIQGVPGTADPAASFGRLTERSAGKDTTTGHWELCGIVLERPFPTFPDGFPQELVTEFEREIGRGTLGNVAASGTEIIRELGAEHLATGNPIIYTSADSVFQIAAHESIIGIEELYEICRVARKLLKGDLGVGRVIARPFIGDVDSDFTRTKSRRDFSLPPTGRTMLDVLSESGLRTAGVGKIDDIFANRGILVSNHTTSNLDGIRATIEFMRQTEKGLIFTNLNDFDTLFGHRNDPKGYARCLEEFDRHLPEILEALGVRDALIITADHGNDPTTASTDHSREQVPLLVTGKRLQRRDLGARPTFADVAATILEMFSLPWPGPGESFLDMLV